MAATDRGSLTLKPGSLLQTMRTTTAQARASGALLSIPTDCWILQDGPVPFLLRVSANLARKEVADRAAGVRSALAKKPDNPFLPYERELFVDHLSPTHLALLNKFNVVDHHLLVVTRAYESQTAPLNPRDFEAMWAILHEIDGLFFYNGGKQAGASQHHKHLQLVPLPMHPSGPRIPVEPLILEALRQQQTRAELGFEHALCALDPLWVANPVFGAAASFRAYCQLLQGLGVNPQQPGAYNLLATRTWMLVIPRSAESYRGIPVNSLGFAGSLFVRNQQQRQQLEDIGPMKLLREVSR